MDDGVDTTNNDQHRPSPKAMADDASVPREPSPFDGEDSAMLDDANEALRFIESTMSMEESQTFIDGIDQAEPVLADRLRRMRDDHRLLRTASLDESRHGDLLGPVRGRLARGELLVDEDLSTEEMAPTGLMEQSVRHVARRRRRVRRRPYEIAAIIGVACTVVGLLIGARLDRAESSTAAEPQAAFDAGSEISSFALAMPVSDPESTETAMSLLADSRNLVLVRNGSSGNVVVGQDRSTDSDRVPPRRIRADLARRGFDYALIVPRDDVSEVVAAMGEMMGAGGIDSAPRLLPSDALDPTAAVGQDALAGWSQQPNIARSMTGDSPFVVVPIAVFPSD